MIGHAVRGRRVSVEVSTSETLAVGEGGVGRRGRATATAEVTYRLLVPLPVPACVVPPAGTAPAALPTLDDVLAFRVRLVA